MISALQEINDCYKLHEKFAEDAWMESWLGSAIYSPTRFLLQFVKENAWPKEVLDLYRAEAVKCFSLGHEAVLRLVEAEFFNKRLFVSSEYNDEITLHKKLEEQLYPDINNACALTLKIASGVSALHEMGIVHANINPDTILVKKELALAASAKLCIPGYAVLINNGLYKQEHGKKYPGFVAAEVQQGKAIMESDYYSVAFLLKYLLKDPINPDLKELLEKLTDNNPETRRQFFNQFIDVLKEYSGFANETIDVNRDTKAAARYSPYVKGPVAVPEAVPRPEVAKYFQDLSATYLSAHQIYTKPVPEQINERLKDVKEESPKKQAVAMPELIKQPLQDVSPGKEDTPLLKPREKTAATELQSNKEVPWSYRRVGFVDVLRSLRISVHNAGLGKGDLRFMENDGSLTVRQNLEEFLIFIKNDNMLADCKSVRTFNANNVASFLKRFSETIADELEMEGKDFIFELKNNLSLAGMERAFSSEPLGKLLFGKNSDDIIITKRMWKKLGQCICMFGRIKRPLVIILNDGEALNKEICDFFLSMIPTLKNSPVCIFVFGKNFPRTMRKYKLVEG